MTARAQRQQRTYRPLWWARGFLVLGLLAGVLAMHGLGPGGMSVGMTDASHDGHHGHKGQRMDLRAGPSDVYVCHGMGSHGGHTQHADATCASGAVPAGYTFPALTPDPVGGPALAARADRSLLLDPEGARAPPSLAELQLLRI